MNDDLFTEELSSEFIRKVIGGRFDNNCTYYLVSTPEGFEISAHNNATNKDMTVLAEDEFEHVTDALEEEELASVIEVKEGGKLSRKADWVVLGICTAVLLASLSIYLSADTTFIGQSINTWMESAAVSIKNFMEGLG